MLSFFIIMSQEKTEKATPKKLRDAKDKGDVPRTKEINTVSILVFTFGFFILFGSGVYSALVDVFTMNFTFSAEDLNSTELLGVRSYASIWFIAEKMVAFSVCVMIINVLANTILGGFIVSGKKLIPDFKKLDPIKGIKEKIFSMKQVVELIKSILKALLVLVPLYMIMDVKFLSYVSSKLLYDPKELIGIVALDILVWGLIFSCIFILVVAIDVPFQIHNFQKQNKMSKDDIKREYKDTEGNPEIKQKRKQAQFAMSQKASKSRLVDADMLVVNPTHYAVGLKYDDTMEVPQVVALGADIVALAMRAKAAEMQIPVLEIPPLARVLYKTTDVGDYIPFELYEPVATVIHHVYSLDDRLAFNINEKFVESLEINEGDF
ncbi:Flagellar biosynthetic protein FlhB [Vibrio chagasii]|nr:Flagellar biosynthetic protein FlhB [Vibrio chagasii]